MHRHRTCITFSAGGIRGVAYVGALCELVDRGDIELAQFTRLHGTSVGALMACLVAIGLSADELLHEVQHFSVDKFTSMNFSSLMYAWGLDDGSRLREYIAQKLREKTGNAELTLGQLWHDRGKDLCTCAVNLTLNSVAYFSGRDTPAVRVVDAVAMSMAVPLVFAPVPYEGHMFIDGAFMDSFPTRGCPPASTLCLRLDWSVASNLKSLEQYFSRVAFCALHFAENGAERAQHESNTVEIDVGDVSTINYCLPHYMGSHMVAVGRRAAATWSLSTRTRYDDR